MRDQRFSFVWFFSFFFRHYATFFSKLFGFYQRVTSRIFWSFRFVKTFNEPEWPPFEFFGIVRLFKKYFFSKKKNSKNFLKNKFFQMFPIVVLWIFLSLRYGADLKRSRLVCLLICLCNCKHECEDVKQISSFTVKLLVHKKTGTCV